MLYVLKSDISDFNFDYDVFGIYTNINELLHASEVVFGGDFDKARQIQEEYGFSGLVFYPIRNDDINKVDLDDNKWSINCNDKTNNFYIDPKDLEYLQKQNTEIDDLKSLIRKEQN